MARAEFPRAVRVAVVKRATKDNVIFCEKCHAIAKKFQVDHVIADAHGGKPVIENAMLICQPCFDVKNPQDTTIAAKIKRQEAAHLRIVDAPEIKGGPMATTEKAASRRANPKPPVIRQWSLYRDI